MYVFTINVVVPLSMYTPVYAGKLVTANCHSCCSAAI
jgi:hypothetical protein